MSMEQAVQQTDRQVKRVAHLRTILSALKRSNISLTKAAEIGDTEDAERLMEQLSTWYIEAETLLATETKRLAMLAQYEGSVLRATKAKTPIFQNKTFNDKGDTSKFFKVVQENLATIGTNKVSSSSTIDSTSRPQLRSPSRSSTRTLSRSPSRTSLHLSRPPSRPPSRHLSMVDLDLSHLNVQNLVPMSNVNDSQIFSPQTSDPTKSSALNQNIGQQFDRSQKDTVNVRTTSSPTGEANAKDTTAKRKKQAGKAAREYLARRGRSLASLNAYGDGSRNTNNPSSAHRLHRRSTIGSQASTPSNQMVIVSESQDDYVSVKFRDRNSSLGSQQSHQSVSMNSSGIENELRRHETVQSERRKLRSGDFSDANIYEAGVADDDGERFVSVSVSEPRTEKSGLLNANTHTTYVCVGLSRTGEKNLVERRYTDFVSLQSALRKQYPALKRVLPAIPEKKLLGKFKPAFIEKRRLGLEAFLTAVVENQSQHVIVARCLNRFMTAVE